MTLSPSFTVVLGVSAILGLSKHKQKYHIKHRKGKQKALLSLKIKNDVIYGIK